MNEVNDVNDFIHVCEVATIHDQTKKKIHHITYIPHRLLKTNS
jgi:hypothetical protein